MWQRLQRVSRGYATHVVQGVEVARGALRVFELVVATLLETDRKRVDTLTGRPGHQAQDRAAVRASGQEGARILGRAVAERARHRFRAELRGAVGRRRLVLRSFLAGHVPVAPHRDLAVTHLHETP